MIVQPTRQAAITGLSLAIDFATASAIIAVMMTGKKATLQRVSDFISGPARRARTISAEQRERITVTRANNGSRSRCMAGRMATVTTMTAAISVKLGIAPISWNP